MGIAARASGRSRHQMPTNLQHGHIVYPKESASVLVSRLLDSINGTYLWRHEFRGTTESACGIIKTHVLLAKTIIGNLDVSIKCQENVVQLQITIDDIVVMEILQSQADLGGIEPEEKLVKPATM